MGRHAKHSDRSSHRVAYSPIRILQTQEELQVALTRASSFDERASDVLRTRSERYRALQAHSGSRDVALQALIGTCSDSAADTSDRERPAGTIQVYADIGCPFAHFSLRRITSLRDQLALNLPIVVRAWPLEMVNGQPLDPAVTATHIAELRRDVAPDLFSGFRPEVLPRSTVKALTLVEAVNDVDPWLGERISLDLRDVLFEQGERLDVEMLRLLSAEAGLDPSVLDEGSRVEARLVEGRQLGVQGSPHVFVGRSGSFCPLLDIERDPSGGLHMHERPERLVQLLKEGTRSTRE